MTCCKTPAFQPPPLPCPKRQELHRKYQERLAIEQEKMTWWDVMRQWVLGKENNGSSYSNSEPKQG
jgi:hypothetical protein